MCSSPSIALLMQKQWFIDKGIEWNLFLLGLHSIPKNICPIYLPTNQG